MRISFFVIFLLILSLIAPLAHAHGPGGKASAMFEAYEQGKIPTPYKGLKNPLSPDPDAIDAGMRIYENSCVMCHGPNADGKGHMAQMLDPFPADLRAMIKMFPNTDDYYFWIIKEGGSAFDVPMPRFKGALSDNEVWQVVAWMQDGFAGAGETVQDHMQDETHKPGDGHMMNQPGGMMKPGQMMGQ